MNQEEILTIFQKTGALLEGHFQLTSGLHSSLYFQCAKVLQYPQHTERLCGEIARVFSGERIDVVAAPALGGIVVGQEVGRQLGVRTIFTERKEDSMQLRRGFTLEPGERALVCEDVVTTGGSVFEVIDIVQQQGAILVGVGYIVDRSNGKVQFPLDDRKKQVGLLEISVETFSPDRCPLCKQGSVAVKPGSRVR